MSKAYLILNGEIDRQWICEVLAGKSDIYCTDGAFKKISGIRISAIFGDMDSLGDSDTGDIRKIYLPDHNYTDFEKTLVHLKENYSSVDIFGASGADVDHFLGNLSVAKKFCKDTQIIFHDRRQYYFFAKNAERISTSIGKIISIMPFPEMKNVFSTGLEYPLAGVDLELGSKISVRNRTTGDSVTIKFERGCGLIVVER